MPSLQTWSFQSTRNSFCLSLEEILYMCNYLFYRFPIFSFSLQLICLRLFSKTFLFLRTLNLLFILLYLIEVASWLFAVFSWFFCSVVWFFLLLHHFYISAPKNLVHFFVPISRSNILNLYKAFQFILFPAEMFSWS